MTFTHYYSNNSNSVSDQFPDNQRGDDETVRITIFEPNDFKAKAGSGRRKFNWPTLFAWCFGILSLLLTIAIIICLVFIFACPQLITYLNAPDLCGKSNEPTPKFIPVTRPLESATATLLLTTSTASTPITVAYSSTSTKTHIILKNIVPVRTDLLAVAPITLTPTGTSIEAVTTESVQFSLAPLPGTKYSYKFGKCLYLPLETYLETQLTDSLELCAYACLNNLNCENFNYGSVTENDDKQTPGCYLLKKDLYQKFTPNSFFECGSINRPSPTGTPLESVQFSLAPLVGTKYYYRFGNVSTRT